MAPTVPSSQAVVIGVSQYLYVNQLRITKDAQGVRDVLASPAYCGYPPERVTVLEDQAATRDAILGALTAACEGARAPGSRTFIYFSGHGGQGPDGQSYLLPVDARKGQYPTTAISARELSRILDRCTGELTVVLDCCRAADMVTPGSADGVVGLRAFADPFRYDIQSKGRVVFAASQADGNAYSSPDAPYGIFTGHMLDGLRGDASTSGGDVTVQQLFDYIQQRVVLAWNGAQRPVFIANIDAFYPLTRYPQPVTPTVIFEKDVYISYDRTDPAAQDWVAHVLRPELEKPDHHLSILDNDYLGYSRLALEQDLVKCRYIVVVLTASYLQQRLDEFTTAIALLQAIDTRTPRFIPILRERFDVPAYIDVFVGLDMTPQREMSVRQELARLIKRLKKPPHER